MTETQSWGGVSVRELNELSERYIELETQAYEVAVGETTLGGLFVAPNSHTLVWDGILDFVTLGDVVLEQLPQHVWLDAPPRGENLVVAAAVFLQSGDMSEVVFSKEKGYQEHQDLLDKHQNLPDNPNEQITAVRYDVAVLSGEHDEDAFDFALTAEKDGAQSVEDERIEMTVQLPEYRSWSPEILQWVVYHHREGATLMESADLDATAEILTSLSLTAPA